MIQAIDQIFVTLKHTLVAACPAALQPVASVVLTVAPLLGFLGTLFALATLLERKGLGRIQNRYGPNRVGPFGLLQPLADGLKALIKEDIVPAPADKVVHLLAPIALLIPIFLTYAVLPFGRNMVAVDLDAGVLYFFAVGAAAELAVFMAGWSSRNKYALLGAMRAIAQMLSYEIPFILSAVTVVMAAGSLSTVRIVEAQAGFTGWLPNWYVFTPWGFAAFLLFCVAMTAEANRAPFDLKEGESEIIAGYYIEYSGFKFALFFLGEYVGLFASSGMAATLFLGGYHAPLPFLAWAPSWAWFVAKILAFLCVFIWIRGTLPRLRMDQLMHFAWKLMLPMALVALVVTGVWRFMAPGVGRWVFCTALVVLPYVALARGLAGARGLGRRVYRFAD